ncbi:MAG: DUF2993 domain-containing protein [Leptolyngbya foveolarum]|uniref:DUF2993 domain-containing protein n=1 Tax=Leptolyngbya foveolarum TaxID=47253 RepID=A0A2W4UDK0_9CYAN|nr:MAG: DUF2993 domain-containing protein [Leptolyngbya foveolarum]
MDAGEQAISSVAEAGIRSQLDAVDELDIEIRTDPMKLTQGQIDKVVIVGKGMVVQNDLRTEEMTLETGPVDIAMMKIPLGKIELDEPAQAEAKVVLKPEDLQAAFNSSFIKQKLRGQKIELPSGNRVTTDASNVVFTIPSPGRIAVAADVMLIEKVETYHVAFSAQPKLVADGHKVTLEDIQYEEDANDMPELTQSLVEGTEDLLDLRNFELDNMDLKFRAIEVQADRIVITAKADIQSFN